MAIEGLAVLAINRWKQKEVIPLNFVAAHAAISAGIFASCIDGRTFMTGRRIRRSEFSFGLGKPLGPFMITFVITSIALPLVARFAPDYGFTSPLSTRKIACLGVVSSLIHGLLESGPDPSIGRIWE
ncbi:hypothetical protein [Candidatus Neptunochlamydia vexilliferae]|uniref:Uncharacterized protein n=1 Tax=Candidatus Neptunichlamydia vexilliferae TaxID=1651774 RepID=A0ABS0AX09_9BACT|nr:hypothetical protein [Candidatus Neptunochlamydia vexilliferae]MBF5058681.1 hypothetical protein [Candidatus Neptunochlamydia vexilliferae]